MNWRKIGIILIGTLACTACNRFGPEIHKAEIEDAIRFNKAIDSYTEWYYVDACILGNLLMRVEQQTHCETYWQKMEYVKLFKIEEYFPEEDENRYMLVLEGLMAKYRDAEVILGPIFYLPSNGNQAFLRTGRRSHSQAGINLQKNTSMA